jgi:hypothetical protein
MVRIGSGLWIETPGVRPWPAVGMIVSFVVKNLAFAGQ